MFDNLICNDIWNQRASFKQNTLKKAIVAPQGELGARGGSPFAGELEQNCKNACRLQGALPRFYPPATMGGKVDLVFILSLIFALFLSVPIMAADTVMPVEAERRASSYGGTARPSSVTAREAADEALKCDNVSQSIAYISSVIPYAASPTERRAMYAFLASLQEAMSLYQDAMRSYSAACAIAAGDAEGMSKKSNEGLVLDAVRCALCAGDHESAARYLSTIAATRESSIKSYAALYKEWAAIGAAASKSALNPPLARLRAYLADSNMKEVRQEILLTLWYVAGDNAAAASLKNDYPASVEAAIVSGKAKMLPVPFWYFMVRMASISANDGEDTGKQGHLPHQESGESASVQGSIAKTGGDGEERATHDRIQLGLFRDMANAKRMADTLQKKGFSPVIATETRASGTTYYIVVIDRPSPDTEDDLRTAGFEFYPVF